MNIHKKTMIANAVAFGIFGLLSLVFGGAGLGAMAVIFSGVNFLAALFLLADNRTASGQTCLLLSGIYLLAGITLCSTFNLGI
jgi:hypothetical protein